VAFCGKPARTSGVGALAVLAAALPLVLASGSACAQPAAAPSTITTIQVDGTAHQVAVDAATDTAYVVLITNDLTGAGAVAVVDMATGAVTASIPVAEPNGIAVDSVTDMVYVTLSKSVVVINGATNSMATTITGFASGDAVIQPIVDPATNTIYVAEAGLGAASIAEIDGATNLITDTASGFLAITDLSESLAINPATDTLYVAEGSRVDPPFDVAVVNASTLAVTDTISLTSAPVNIAANPATDAFYIADNDGALSAYDGATNELTGSVVTSAVGNEIAVNAETGTVSAADDTGPAPHGVYLYNTSATATTGYIPMNVPAWVAVDRLPTPSR
jgi:DNA-binding beta-propeller fold protein YncE